MTTSCNSESNTVSLYLAMELSNGTWKLAFSPGRGRKPRLRNVSARDLNGLLRESLDVGKDTEKTPRALTLGVRC